MTEETAFAIYDALPFVEQLPRGLRDAVLTVFTNEAPREYAEAIRIRVESDAATARLVQCVTGACGHMSY